jgi:hypothetical protein
MAALCVTTRHLPLASAAASSGRFPSVRNLYVVAKYLGLRGLIFPAWSGASAVIWFTAASCRASATASPAAVGLVRSSRLPS